MAANPSFQTFFNGWLSRQEELLRQLERLLSPQDGFDRNRECSEIIPRVVAHYNEFYRQKAIAAGEDVFLVISPPWLSSFERALLWISGFRPSMFFPILNRSLAGELTPGQRRRIEEVKADSRRMENEISQAMARLQEKVAEPPLCRLFRRFGSPVDSERPELDRVMEELKAAMVAMIGNADVLQGWTVGEVVRILNPVQGVKFLAALTRFQLQARASGVERDGRRESATDDYPSPDDVLSP